MKKSNIEYITLMANSLAGFLSNELSHKPKLFNPRWT